MECSSSEHKPLLIYPYGVPVKFNKPWRFKQIWLEDEGCHDIVASAWREGEGGFTNEHGGGEGGDVSDRPQTEWRIVIEIN